MLTADDSIEATIATPTACRVCGCTDRNACDVSAVPCFWVEGDLCSACATVEQVLEARGGLAWLLAVAADISRQMENEVFTPAMTGIEGQSPTYTTGRTAERVFITCRRCGMTSWHPKDVENLYCANCHQFHNRDGGQEAGSPK